MPTTKPRLNLTISEDLLLVLTELSEIKNKPISTLALEFIIGGMEIDEDMHWSKIADERFKNCKKWISHKDAWK